MRPSRWHPRPERRGRERFAPSRPRRSARPLDHPSRQRRGTQKRAPLLHFDTGRPRNKGPLSPNKEPPPTDLRPSLHTHRTADLAHSTGMRCRAERPHRTRPRSRSDVTARSVRPGGTETAGRCVPERAIWRNGVAGTAMPRRAAHSCQGSNTPISRPPPPISMRQGTLLNSLGLGLGRPLAEAGDELIGLLEAQRQPFDLDRNDQAATAARGIDRHSHQPLAGAVDQPLPTPAVGTPAEHWPAGPFGVDHRRPRNRRRESQPPIPIFTFSRSAVCTT